MFTVVGHFFGSLFHGGSSGKCFFSSVSVMLADTRSFDSGLFDAVPSIVYGKGYSLTPSATGSGSKSFKKKDLSVWTSSVLMVVGVAGPGGADVGRGVPRLILRFGLFIFDGRARVGATTVIGAAAAETSFVNFPLRIVSRYAPLRARTLSVISAIAPSPFSRIRLGSSVTFSVAFFRDFSSLFLWLRGAFTR